MQAAGGLIDLAAELAAGMQRGQDDLEGRFVLELGMGVDGDAAAVVGDGDEAVGLELELDPAGMAGHRLVHGVVQDLGDEMMHGALVGAADIHAGAAANGLQPLEDFDVLGGIIGRFLGRGGEQVIHGGGLW